MCTDGLSATSDTSRVTHVKHTAIGNVGMWLNEQVSSNISQREIITPATLLIYAEIVNGQFF